jgi:predicted solute-binding protein
VAHRDEYVKLAMIPGHSYFTALSSEQLRHYLDLYANETTVSILEKDQQGFEELLRRATSANLLENLEPVLAIDWI